MDKFCPYRCSYNYQFEKKNPTNEEKVEILDHLIQNSDQVDELIQYRSARALVKSDMGSWKDVLSDIGWLEQNGELTNEIKTIKILCSLYIEIDRSRASLMEMINAQCCGNHDYQVLLWKTLDHVQQKIRNVGKKKQRTSNQFQHP